MPFPTRVQMSTFAFTIMKSLMGRVGLQELSGSATFRKLFPLTLVAACMPFSAANADIIVQYQDVNGGTDLRFDWSGSLTHPSAGSIQTGLFSDIRGDQGGTTGWDRVIHRVGNTRIFSNVSVTQTSGTNGFFDGQGTFSNINEADFSGHAFGFLFFNDASNLGLLWLDDDVASGATLSGGVTYQGINIASSGIQDAVFNIAGAGTVTFGTAAVPEPSSFAFIGLGTLGIVSYRRKKKQIT